MAVGRDAAVRALGALVETLGGPVFVWKVVDEDLVCDPRELLDRIDLQHPAAVFARDAIAHLPCSAALIPAFFKLVAGLLSAALHRAVARWVKLDERVSSDEVGRSAV